MCGVQRLGKFYFFLLPPAGAASTVLARPYWPVNRGALRKISLTDTQRDTRSGKRCHVPLKRSSFLLCAVDCARFAKICHLRKCAKPACDAGFQGISIFNSHPTLTSSVGNVSQRNLQAHSTSVNGLIRKCRWQLSPGHYVSEGENSHEAVCQL